MWANNFSNKIANMMHTRNRNKRTIEKESHLFCFHEIQLGFTKGTSHDFENTTMCKFLRKILVHKTEIGFYRYH